MRSSADDVQMTYVPADNVQMMYIPADDMHMTYPPADDVQMRFWMMYMPADDILDNVPDDICHLPAKSPTKSHSRVIRASSACPHIICTLSARDFNPQNISS